MGAYSIKELEKLSGIKAHTLRIWEQRYQVIAPERTETNIRLYSDEQLKKVLNIALLNSHGYKISKIAALNPAEVQELVHQISLKEKSTNVYIDALVINMLELDEYHFVSSLNDIVSHLGIKNAIYKVLYPLLEKIGVLWQVGSINPAHEHFISNLVRQKIIVEIEKLPIPTKSSKNIILFLPENELHEIGLLFNHYIARELGYKTLYLGQSVPFDDLAKIVDTFPTDIFICSFTTVVDNDVFKETLIQYSKAFSSKIFLISGFQTMNYTKKLPSNFIFFKSLADLEKKLSI